MKVKVRIIMLLLFISTFIMQTICNINLGNTNQRTLKKSFSVPIDPEIIVCIGIIMEGVMFIKKSRKSCI